VPAPEPTRNEPKSGNVFSVEHRVPAAERVRMNGHRGGILWFTGLSGAGKSTLAVELERLLLVVVRACRIQRVVALVFE